MGYKELSNLSKTMSVSTLKYCVYDEMLNTPLQLFGGCCSNPSAGTRKKKIPIQITQKERERVVLHIDAWQ